MRKILKKVGHRVPVVKNFLQSRHELAINNGILQLEKGNLEADIRNLNSIIESPRNFLAHHFIRGNGIEIGAAHLPIKMPEGAHVKYVDVFSSEELRRIFPEEYTKVDIVEVDVVDDGEKLAKFKNNSLDFIIANHFLEHCLDPIGTLITMYGKLRDQGVLYMGIPEKRHTFDKVRGITPYEHLVEEHNDKTNMKFREAHTEEAVRLTDPKKHPNQASIDTRVKELLGSGFRVHYHVWTQKEMTELFIRIAKEYSVDFEIEALVKNLHEVIYVLRKKPAAELRSKRKQL
jgi:SAM-dependent methyltransferase